MSKETETVKLLKSIESKLATLITLTRLIVPKQKPTNEEKKILELCNRKNTVSDIVRKTQKKKNSVEVLLSSLRSKGMIKSAILSEKDPSTGKYKNVYGKV